ncbi:hypothetical protein FGADI_5750 [Fusarium gaditjirri]|uniref:Thioester reductase (TE) domain-containing protein n=1 Tax=Fusarium gaditjirri TaxID=282569 RepID=A0A8H4T9U9_9HYPO|nr:hypothetical protein FGADI_5750 [Fusarium gaditjirri]
MYSWLNATSGGEAITAQLKTAFKTLQQPPALTYCYGPTEISCCATMKTIGLGDNGDDSVYFGHAVPQGLTGEICVGGVGVVLSYLDEKSTSQWFVPNLFASAEHTEKGWTTMYRTGDKGLIRADGGLQFIRRVLCTLRDLSLTQISSTLVATRYCSSDSEVQLRSLWLPLSDMYRSSTPYGMADLVTQQKSSDYVSEIIDWEAETALPRSIDLSYSRNATPVRTETSLEILMTGSTSFLGKQILQSLLKRPSVARIHCVAVDPVSAANHLKDDRVTNLQATVDTIILAGSQGDCLNNYSTLRAPSLESTGQMGLFALGPRVPLHYISSNRVTLLDSSTDAALPPVSVRGYQPPTDGSEGFTAAKWAGEVCLESLSEAAASNEESGLPVSIHRHCAIVGDEAPIEAALNALLRYSKLINAVPRVSSLIAEGYFDFLPVTDAADVYFGNFY